MMGAPVAADDADAPPRPQAESGEATPFEYAAFEFLHVADSGDITQAAGQATATLVEKGIDYWFGGVGEGAPDWAKRIEFEVDLQDNNKPEFSILTVQPLYQSADRRDTVFTQLRLASLHQFGDRRTGQNAGIGYRRTLADDNAMLGINVFHDYEWENHHGRMSVGVEGRWGPVDLFVNKYWALSGEHSAGGGASERPLDGRDIEAALQLPYLPWARLHARRFFWDSEDRPNDIDGWSASLEADLHQNLQVEAGVTDDNATEREAYVNVRMRLASWGGTDRPVAASSALIADEMFSRRDMRDYALDKVRRENKIILERSSGGVTISRGS